MEAAPKKPFISKFVIPLLDAELKPITPLKVEEKTIKRGRGRPRKHPNKNAAKSYWAVSKPRFKCGPNIGQFIPRNHPEHPKNIKIAVEEVVGQNHDQEDAYLLLVFKLSKNHEER